MSEKQLKGTETEKNLLKAFAGESMARNKYNIFATQAKKEGYNYISKIFTDLAENEKEHAKIWYKWFNDEKYHTTADNLKTAINSENNEWEEMYSSFALKAKEEGFESLGELFEHVARVERHHYEMLKKLLLTIENKDAKPDEFGDYKWECSNCGCILEDKEEPKFCPLCEGEDIFFFKRH